MASGENVKVTNKDCTFEDPGITVRKLIELIEHPIATTYIDRQIDLLNDLIRATVGSFWMRDIPFIGRLLELLLERKKRCTVFDPYFSRILSICSIPPMLMKSSEPTQSAAHMQEFFNVLGFLLITLDDQEQQNLVTGVIMSLIDRKAPTEHQPCVSAEFCQEAIGNSSLPEIIARLFEIADDNLYQKLVELALKLSKNSHIICQKMASQNAVSTLLLRFYPKWRNDEDDIFGEVTALTIQDYFPVTNLLWRLLNAIKNSSDELRNSIDVPTVMALKSFLKVFKIFTKTKGYEVERNNLFAIFLYCMTQFPKSPVIQSGLTNDICLLSVATEMGTSGTWASDVRFLPEESNYEFKKMLLVALCKCNPTKNMLKKHKVIPGLLRIITPGLTIPWFTENHCYLIRMVFCALQSLIPNAFEEFVLNSGPLRALMIVEYYLICPYYVDVLLSGLQFIKYLLSLNVCEITSQLQDNCIVNIILCLWKVIMESSLSLMYQKCLTYIFCILEKLECTNTKCYTSIYLEFMDRVMNTQITDCAINERMLIYSLNFLWEKIISNTQNGLKAFVSGGGVFKLLDLMNKHALAVKLVGLGILVDMCEDSTCIPFIVTWRSKGKIFLEMLMNIFNRENQLLGVKLTENGIIEDTDWPLMGTIQRSETMQDDKNFNSSPSVIDMLGSCRPKVYALLQLLNYRHQKKVDLCNKHYRIFDKKISFNDQKLMDEQELYRLLREARLANSLKALTELEYLARTTDGLLRMKKVMKQRNQVPSEKTNIGRLMFKINVTPIHSQKIWIDVDETKSDKSCDIKSLSSTSVSGRSSVIILESEESKSYSCTSE